jgi:dolichol-phosphate mannosyltransferase
MTAATTVRALSIIPTYNEVENLRPLAEQLLALSLTHEVLCVDDNSPDGTGALADQIAAAEPRFHVIHRLEDRGYAKSSKAGLAWALEQGYDIICTMDGDLSHDPAALPGMLARIDAGADLVIGSRYTAGGGLQVDWSPLRRAVSEMGSAYARLMIGTPVRDCTSGYRCYRATTLRDIDLGGLYSDGYSFLIEILAAIAATGARIEESPITYVDRLRGQSKISRSIILEALLETTRLGLRRIAGGKH